MPRMGASEYSVFSAARHAWVKRRPIVQRVMRSERLFLASSRSLDTFSVVHQGNVEFLEVSWRKLGILPPSASRFPLISGHDQFAPVCSSLLPSFIHIVAQYLEALQSSGHLVSRPPGEGAVEPLSTITMRSNGKFYLWYSLYSDAEPSFYCMHPGPYTIMPQRCST